MSTSFSPARMDSCASGCLALSAPSGRATQALRTYSQRSFVYSPGRMELIAATPWLKPLMPGGGFHLGRKLSDEQRADVQFGFHIAKEVSRLEIGQTVVVKRGAVLAVEGFEGTDRCLSRGGELAGKEGGAVAVKAAKEKHDLRFDIPCIGSRTLEICASAGVSVLALEAGKTLLLDEHEVREFVPRRNIVLTTVT